METGRAFLPSFLPDPCYHILMRCSTCQTEAADSCSACPQCGRLFTTESSVEEEGVRGQSTRYNPLGPVQECRYGQVHRARDPLTDRTVAFYRLRESLLPDSSRLEKVKLLDHPNLIRVYDFGRDHQGGFLVTEWVEGTCLQNLFSAGGAVSFEEAVRVIREVGAALGYAHRNGCLHLSLCPLDVVLKEGGRVKVGGFGFQPEERAERPDLAGFLAPEIRGNPIIVDERADLYSLGALFYYLLTKALPDPIRIEEVPEEARSLVVRALDRDHSGRFETVDEMLRELGSLVPNTPSVPPQHAAGAFPEPYDLYARFFDLLDDLPGIKGGMNANRWLGKYQTVCRAIASSNRDNISARRLVSLRMGGVALSRKEVLLRIFRRFSLGGGCEESFIEELDRFRKDDPLIPLLKEGAQVVETLSPAGSVYRGAMAFPMLIFGTFLIIGGGLAGFFLERTFLVFGGIGVGMLSVGGYLLIPKAPRSRKEYPFRTGSSLGKRFREIWPPSREQD